MSWQNRVGLATGLVVLNASVTFENAWPTPSIHWGNALSIELAIALLMIGLIAGRMRDRPRRILRGLAGIWLLLAVGRYADVTAPALYGREVNLYWDLPHVSNVAAMLAKATRPWLVVVVVLGTVTTTTALFVLLNWCWQRVGESATTRGGRRALIGVATIAMMAFVAAPVHDEQPGRLGFSAPVAASYARHIRLAAKTLATRGTNTLPPSPPLDSDLSVIEGADVLLIFIESYGATAWERPEYSTPLEKDRVALAAAVRDSGRDIVSAYVESPTFGGVSWLAHISLLSGVEVRDPERNALLMADTRETLVTAFSRGGYRTVAFMPGLWQEWPEGAFYGFDNVYGGGGLGYRGPEFGWWSIPDQYTIARLDQIELRPAPRRPVFAFLPTVNTHAPFSPTPPYQPDWERILTEYPYDQEEVNRAWEQWVDWLNLGPSYVRSVAYTYTALAGYLRARPERDFVMILIGDHQPAAAVSGTDAAWDVPVHVIASRQPVLDRLVTHGFGRGITPRRPTLGPMHTLLPVLLDSFGNRPLTARTTQSALP